MTELTNHICRECGKLLVSETVVCPTCGARLMMGILARSDRNHRGDIVLAVLTFGLTSFVLLAPAVTDPWSLETTLWRTYLFGVPGALVMRKWYFLMLDPEPDYGQLWHVYWLMQIAAWLGSFLFAIVIYAIPPAVAALWNLIFR